MEVAKRHKVERVHKREYTGTYIEGHFAKKEIKKKNHLSPGLSILNILKSSPSLAIINEKLIFLHQEPLP
jgi:hypothetical protein